jgi:Uri superfamily endonuclease
LLGVLRRRTLILRVNSVSSRMTGSYILLIKLNHKNDIIVGSLGATHFPCGFYTYVGSALNSLESRIKYHLKTLKKYRWHVDYLLGKATIYGILLCESTDRQECTIAQALSEQLTLIPKFGASDCSCQSHLFFKSTETKPIILTTLKNMNTNPKTILISTIKS